MGYYTELILGCSLKIDTPQFVIDTLKYLGGQITKVPEGYPFSDDDSRLDFYFFSRSSYCFGVCNAHFSLTLKDDFKPHFYILDARCNLKNYNKEIQTFLDWLEPYVDHGSGSQSFYAIVTPEDGTPIFYYSR